MSVTATPSNHAFFQFARKKIDLDTDTIKVLLMRSGFVFNEDNHAKLANIHGVISVITLAINANKELIDSGNGLLAAGFVPGNQVTIAGFTAPGNSCTKIISTVEAGKITFTSTTGLVEEIEGDAVTVTANDELPTNYGYTQDDKVLASTTVTEDDANNRCEMTCDGILWTASGGSIGPTPGAILYSDTSEDDTILGYLDFGGEKTATTGEDFGINNLKIRLAKAA